MKDADIQRMKEIIVNEYHPDKIILFGSCARGDAVGDSDIDLLVISDNECDLPRFKRGLDVRKKLAFIENPFDILFYTEEELKRYNHIEQSFSANVQREGKILYG